MNKIKNLKGFSIIEITISIGIIAIGLIGISSLIVQNIQVQNLNKNYLIASMLSQEGIELVRNYRDSDWLDPMWQWNSSIIKDKTYTIDYTKNISDTPDDCFDDLARLYLDSDGFYVHESTGNSPTPFYRLITIVEHFSPDYLEVESSVKWRDRGRENEYNIKTELYNWQ